MTKFSTLALAAIVATVGAAAVSPAQQPQAKQKAAKDYNLTKEVRQLAGEAQKLITAGDNAGALAKLQQAAPLAQTPDDKFIVGNILIDAGSKLNDTKVQSQGVDLMIASGSQQGADLGKLQFYAGRFAYTAGDYAKALPLFQSAQQNGHQDPQLTILIADSSLKSNKTGEGLATLRKAVEAEFAAGRKPDENWLKRGVAVAYQAKQPAELAWWTQQQIKAYPTPQNWRTALVTYRDGANLEPQAELDLMRLMRATKSLQGKRDYFEYADFATNRGLNGEVVAVIDEGAATGTFTKTEKGFSELYKLASGKVSADRASLVKEEARAEKAAAAKEPTAIADAYLGYRDYAKAAKFYQLALTKPGVDAATVNTRLGIALALSGQKPAAKEAFAKVTGPREGVANYWELYLDQTA